jgi:hypothetical protein
MSYCYVGNILWKQWKYIGDKNDWNHSPEELEAFAEFKSHVDYCEECRKRQLKDDNENHKNSR